MFKRVGATIVTIVMLLSMVASFSSAASSTDPMSLVVETVGGQSLVKPGEEVTLLVKIKNPIPAVGLTVLGRYNTDLFEPAGEVIVGEFTKGGVTMSGAAEEAANAEIGAAWIAPENIQLDDGALLLTVPLKAKSTVADLTAAEISFEFFDEGMFCADASGEAVAAPAASYTTTSAVVDITIAAAAPSLVAKIVDGQTGAKPGETFQVLVSVKDYTDDWSTMTFKGTYDQDLFELTDYKPLAFGDAAIENVVLDIETAGIVRACWINTEVVDMATPDFDVLELTFVVKDDAAVTEDANFSFSFIEEGIIKGKNADGSFKNAVAGDFIATPAEAVIDVLSKDVKTYLTIKTDKDTVKAGEDIEVTLSLNDYQDNWAGFGTQLTYDSSKFAVKSVAASNFGGQGAAETDYSTAGKVNVGWIPVDPTGKTNMVVDGDAAIELVKVVLTATENADAADVEFNAIIADGVVSMDGDNKVPLSVEEGYVKAADTVKVDIEAVVATDPAYLTIETNKTSVTEGEEIEVTLKLNKYADNWAAFGTMLTYDSSKFTLKTTTPSDFGGQGTAEVLADVAGEVKAAWITKNTSTKTNMEVAGDDAIELIKVVFTATAAAEDVAFDAEILDGIASVDSNGIEVTLPAEEGYVKAADSVKVDIDAVVATDPTYLTIETNKTSVAEGEEIEVTLKLNKYADNWAAFATQLTYDSAKFTLKSVTPSDFGGQGEAAVEKDTAGKVNIGFIPQNASAKENMVVAGDDAIELAKIVFTAGADAAAADIAFDAFIADDIITIDGSGSEAYVPVEENYIKEADTVKVTITEKIVPTYITIETNKTSVDEGGEIEVTIKLNEYNDNWAAFATQLTYDSSKFTLKSVTPSDFGGQGEAAVEKDTAGKVNIGFIPKNASAKENMVVAGDDAIELAKIVFTAGADAAATDVAFGAFIADGIITIDGSGKEAYVPVEENYTKEAEDVKVTINDVNLAPTTSLEIKTDKTVVNKGEEIEVTLNLNNYNDNWAGFGIKLDYDAAKFTLKSVTPSDFGGQGISETNTEVAGEVKVAWITQSSSPKGNMEVAGEDAIELVKIVFTANEAAEDVAFDAEIMDGVVTIDDSGDEVILSVEENYTKAADPVKVTITDIVVLPTTFLEIVTNKATVDEGEDIEVTLNLKNYNDNWAGFGIKLNYDDTKFTLKSVTPTEFGGQGTPETVTNVAGEVKAAWLTKSASPKGNMVVDGNDPIELVKVVFTAGADAAAADIAFNAEILDGVATIVGGNEENLPVEENYTKAADPVKVTINDVPNNPPYISIEADSLSVDEGQNGTIKLYLNDYTNKWCAMGLTFKYDKSLISIDKNAVSVKAFGGNDGVAEFDAANGTISFGWLSRTNVNADRKILLAEIPYKAIKDGTATFEASFKKDGVATIGAAGKQFLTPGTDYAEVAQDQDVVIIDKYVNMDPPSLTVENDVDSLLKRGTGVSTIKLNNYHSRWCAITVEYRYDPAMVEIKESDVDAQTIGGIEPVVVVNAASGIVSINWTGADNIAAAQALTLAKIKYTAIKDGNTSFTANFKDNGVFWDNDGTETVQLPEIDYTKESNAAAVEITTAPYLSATVAPTNVNVGDEVTLTISLNDYRDLWSSMSIIASYDKALLKPIKVTQHAFGSASEYSAIDESKGTISAVWYQTENVKADDNLQVMTIVFKAIEGGTAAFDVSFKDGEGVLTNGTTPLTPGEHYAVSAENVSSVKIKPCVHTWGTPKHIDGTETTKAKHLYTCTKGCGTTKEEKCTIKTKKAAATCTKAGTITYSCSVCKYSKKVNDPNAPALGHDYSGTPVHKKGTSKHVYTCLRDGCSVKKEVNCTYKKQKIAATCLEDGYTIYTCKVCKDVSERDVVKAKGKHGKLVLHYWAPTTAKNGRIATVCETCSEIVRPPYTGARYQLLKKGHPFPDVQDPKSWYYKAVNFNKAFGVFGGDDLGNFNPSSNITRGQLVTVLGRIMMPEAEKEMTNAQFNAFLKKQTSKVDGMKSTSGFTDISGRYYERYAKLFAKWGIINGYGDGTFKGDNNITRQEIATLIKRFIEAYNGTTSGVKFGAAASFKDFSTVSDWAKDNVKWVGKVGLFQGDTAKNYNPHSNATRAEIAMVIYRMLPVLDNIVVHD